MNQVYIYKADIYCTNCALAIRERLGWTDAPDSDDYPQGPYSNGGGEADAPQHCGNCHTFLENPLTSDGMEYVRDNQRDEWDSFYGIERDAETERESALAAGQSGDDNPDDGLGMMSDADLDRYFEERKGWEGVRYA